MQTKQKEGGDQYVKMEANQNNASYTIQLNYPGGPTVLFYDVCSEPSGGNVKLF